MPLQFTLTTAGRNAIVNANNTGTNPVVVTKVGIGSASWTPTIAATALNTEIKKITAIGGGAVANDTIHVTASDSSADVYTVKEIGLFLADNTLLAVYSQVDPIIVKGAATVALIAADLVITGVPAGSVTVGDTTFDYPQATESVKGVAEIATTSEAQNGADDTRIITPAKLQDVTATETRKGVIELATSAEVQTGTDTTRAVTPAGLASRTATSTRAGIVELATDAEVQTGTDDTRAVTPGGLNACTATETRRGVIELATDAEALALVDTSRAITASNLNAMTSTESQKGIIRIATDVMVNNQTNISSAVVPSNFAAARWVPRAWVAFNGSGTVSINSDHNVSSITDLGVGKYRVNFTNAIGNTAYAAFGSAVTDDTGGDGDNDTIVSFSTISSGTSVTFWVNDPTNNTRRDSPRVSILIMSDPAA